MVTMQGCLVISFITRKYSGRGGRNMSEQELMQYWQIYTMAWKLIKNFMQVSEQQIAKAIENAGTSIFNRIFCLVVWPEVKKLKNNPLLYNASYYQKIFTESWMLFKRYSNPDDSEAFWDNLVHDITSMAQIYDRNQMVENLLIHVTLEEIERIWKVKKSILENSVLVSSL